MNHIRIIGGSNMSL